MSAGRKAGRKIVGGFYTKRIFVSMTDDMYKTLKGLADRYGITQAEVIRQCIMNSLKISEPLPGTISFPESEEEPC
jgi:hypothetical protein